MVKINKSPTREPVTTSGIYECTDGTFVRVHWRGGQVHETGRYATREEADRAEYPPEADLDLSDVAHEASIRALESTGKL